MARKHGSTLATRPPKKRVISIVGERYGRLTVRAHVGMIGAHGTSMWECVCDCGQVISVRTQSLKKERTRSCGCYYRDWSSKPRPDRRTHGDSGTKLYFIWRNIKDRCENPKAQAFSNYGGRGIYICDRWRESFAAFRDDIGPKPSPTHSLDRIDNNGPYSPENCRWATRLEQQRNTRRFCGQCRIAQQQKPIEAMTLEELASESTRLAYQEYEIRAQRGRVDLIYQSRA